MTLSYLLIFKNGVARMHGLGATLQDMTETLIENLQLYLWVILLRIGVFPRRDISNLPLGGSESLIGKRAGGSHYLPGKCSFMSSSFFFFQ